MRVCISSVLLLLFFLPLSFGEPTNLVDPITAYRKLVVEGWTVRLHKDYDLKENTALRDEVLVHLRQQFKNVKSVLPAPATKRMQDVLFWIEVAHPKHRGMCFHSSAKWLGQNEMLPAKAGGVEIANGRNFLDWEKDQPWGILHELSHAWHWHVLGHKDEGILKAFHAAEKRRDNESVKHANGRMRRHYGLSNQMEYFAEATEASLGRNDFHPFTLKQLKAKDPAAYAMVRRAYGFDGPRELKVKSVEVDKIWDESPHNAFTDLVFWQNRFVCAFREGRGHVSTDGRIRLLESPFGKKWKPLGTVTKEGLDLRDAQLSITPSDELMLVGGMAKRSKDGASAPTSAFSAFSKDGKTWSEHYPISAPNRWLWSVTWQGDQAFGVPYGGDRPSALHRSLDGRTFNPLVDPFLDQPGTTEARIAFGADGLGVCLHRRDGSKGNSAFLGTANPPYREWAWRDLGVYVGGPNLIQLPTGEWLAAGRRKTAVSGPRTGLYQFDPKEGELRLLAELPSGGDTSYPGLVWHAGRLFVSYYSSHEGRASIYLARVAFNER